MSKTGIAEPYFRGRGIAIRQAVVRRSSALAAVTGAALMNVDDYAHRFTYFPQGKPRAWMSASTRGPLR